MQRASKSDTHVYNIYGINQEEPGGREVTSKKGEEERKGRKKITNGFDWTNQFVFVVRMVQLDRIGRILLA